jgi:hypothetical protein
VPTPKLILDITMSLDGYVAGPNASLEQPLGAGGVVASLSVTHLRYRVASANAR